jgi:hypothetical protein
LKLLLLCLIGCVSLVAADFQWMDTQIENEFQTFKRTGITATMLDSVIQNIPNIGFGHALRRFQIIDRKVYGPAGGPKGLLEKIAQLYPVPDVDVILLDQDIIWNHWVLTGPVLATCKMAYIFEIKSVLAKLQKTFTIE